MLIANAELCFSAQLIAWSLAAVAHVDACENVNGQIKKGTRVVGLFPSEESLLRLVTGVLIEISETWETGKTYLTPS